MMDEILEALQNPDAFPEDASHVEVIQTHISMVFRIGESVYKIKKPVDLGFVDFSTLEKRAHFCHEEVRLNRRLAPDVYRGVVPITRTDDGLKVGGAGEAVDWAVWMRRLPDEATYKHLLRTHQLNVDDVERLARMLATFHEEAEGGQSIAESGRWEVVAGNCRENFAQCASMAGEGDGVVVDRRLFTRVRDYTEALLTSHQGLIAKRAESGVPRDTHGDLRLGHIYRLPDGAVVIIDCVEFNARFRHADPVADVAFLVMEFLAEGRRDLAERFSQAWFEASGDVSGQPLLPFYVAYRAVVRAKVEGMTAREREVPRDERSQALWRARRRWTLALSVLAPPEERPCLVLMAGLPGVGKSVLARRLAKAGRFMVIRTDEVRKTMRDPASASRAGLYSHAAKARAYQEVLWVVRGGLRGGRRVIADAGFWKESHRKMFVEAARRLSVPVIILHCEATEETLRARLSARRGDASDADWRVCQKAMTLWEGFGPETAPDVRVVDAEADEDAMLVAALAALRGEGLYGA